MFKSYTFLESMLAREARGADGRASAERHHSAAGGFSEGPQKRAFAVALEGDQT